MTQKTYKVAGMDCASCATLIELDFEDAGISVSCDYAKQELIIKDDGIPLEKVKQVLETQGYTIAAR